MPRIELGGRNNSNVGFSGETMCSSNMVFGFFEFADEGLSDSSWGSSEELDTRIRFDDNEIEEDDSDGIKKNKAFWEAQYQLLTATLHRTSSLESKIRKVIKEALKDLTLVDTCCVCRRPVTGGCRSCIRTEISNRIRNAGFDCVLCKSKWRSSPEIPAGEHTYIEVLDKSNSKKGEVRVVIELNFRGEFEMARASEDYNGLITQLPQVFIGKSERLKSLIKILCSAAKKCIKDNKMHMGPWRKHKYMQAKWFGVCERMTLATPLPPVGISDRPPRPRASLLTFDMLENNNVNGLLHFSNAVQVV